jgi:hypothetical protein
VVLLCYSLPYSFLNLSSLVKEPDPRKMQINLTGFLNGKHARIFMGELWQMLDSAQKNESGIPQELLDLKVPL